MRLVEVVDVEDELALSRPEDAEIRQMRVAAELGLKPDSGVPERSAAMIAAAPRKKANGETSMRPCRIGTSSGMRVAACSSRIAIGSGRVADGCQSAWARRGVAFRTALPRSARSVAETYSCTESG